MTHEEELALIGHSRDAAVAENERLRTELRVITLLISQTSEDDSRATLRHIAGLCYAALAEEARCER